MLSELFPDASEHRMVIVYTRPPPAGFRVAARFKVRSPVIWTSRGSEVSLHETPMIFPVGAGSQLSETETEIVTGTIWWFGGESMFGVAVAELMVGAVVSATMRATSRVALFP